MSFQINFVISGLLDTWMNVLATAKLHLTSHRHGDEKILPEISLFWRTVPLRLYHGLYEPVKCKTKRSMETIMNHWDMMKSLLGNTS